MAKKIRFSDEWGQIVEYKRYRDSRTGKFLKDRTRVAAKFKRAETIQYRYVGGKRFGEPVYKLTGKEIRKTTLPGGVMDNEGSIKESLRDTNIFTQVHRAKSALIHIRGLLPNGDMWRHQFVVKKFGDQNQSEQLVNAIYWGLASFGLRTNYNIEQVRFHWTKPRDARKREPLRAMQISVSLYKYYIKTEEEEI